MPSSNVRPVIFLKGEDRRAPRSGARCTRVGAARRLRQDRRRGLNDIDPANTNAVFWSMAYRANPVDDVHGVLHRSSGHGPKSGRVSNHSSLLIDATLKQAFPPLALPTGEFMAPRPQDLG